jgi:putative DNA primase/helicase
VILTSREQAIEYFSVPGNFGTWKQKMGGVGDLSLRQWGLTNWAPPEAVAPVKETLKPPTVVDPLPELPAFLKGINNWVRWKLETVNNKPTKVPYRMDGRKAASTRPEDWTDYRTAVTGAVIDDKQGIGFVVNGGIVGFDLDGCRNPQTGKVASWAESIVDALDCYTEYTPSGYGLRVWVRGVLSEGDRVFNLDPAVGFGDKVKIEVFTEGRYFTVTGDSYLEGADVEERDLGEVYQLCHEIRAKHPAAKKEKATASATTGSSVQVERAPGTLSVDKLTVLMNGDIKSTEPFVIEYLGNSLEYPSHSEADMSLATCLAFQHGDNSELIATEFAKSPLGRREKWLNREDYRQETIKKAIKSAQETNKSNTQSALAAQTASQPSSVLPSQIEETIPEFDPSVITGIYKEIVDLVCEGTTIPRQFPFLAAKVYIGARMAGKMTFENLDADSSYYGTVIAETGTGKGLAWRRTVEGVFQTNIIDSKTKIIYSADSGAGLKDTFFEPPAEYPVICYIDEVTSLGHKAGEKKNPEIVDTIIELADSHRISRVLAKQKGQRANRTTDNARLSLYMCGQNGEVFMSSFAGRTKLGIYDRLYPEFSPNVEAGDLPNIHIGRAAELLNKILKLDFSGEMTMSPETKTRLDAFWKNQPAEIRKKPRFKKHLMLDMYMAAFGRGVRVAEVEDLDVAVKIFHRQIVIRRVHFTDEVPDKVGLYLGKFKSLTEGMRRRLNAGEPMASVAMSVRDFQTMTNAYRDNDLQTFNGAWRNWEQQVVSVDVIAKNGHKYKKFVPVPNEDEMWASPTAVPATAGSSG